MSTSPNISQKDKFMTMSSETDEFQPSNLLYIQCHPFNLITLWQKHNTQEEKRFLSGTTVLPCRSSLWITTSSSSDSIRSLQHCSGCLQLYSIQTVMPQPAFKNTVGDDIKTLGTSWAKWPLLLFLIHKYSLCITEDNQVSLTHGKSILTVPSHAQKGAKKNCPMTAPGTKARLTCSCLDDSLGLCWRPVQHGPLFSNQSPPCTTTTSKDGYNTASSTALGADHQVPWMYVGQVLLNNPQPCFQVPLVVIPSLKLNFQTQRPRRPYLTEDWAKKTT